MKIALYIGHHKVGSTSLQAFLARNAHRLLQDGVLYPAVDFHGLAFATARAADREVPPGPLSPRLREPHNALAYNMIAARSRRPVPSQFHQMPNLEVMIGNLRGLIGQTRPETVVICSEALVNFGEVDPVLVDDLREILPEAETTIYCALRRPDDYLVSWHNQRIKVGEKVGDLPSHVGEYMNTIHFDFATAVRPWTERWPGARVVLRDYSEIQAAGGSVPDFFDQTGLTVPPGAVSMLRANLSLHPALAEIARLGNDTLSDPQAFALRNYLMRAGPRLDLPSAGSIESLGAEQRERLLAGFRPIHDWLGQITGAPFFKDVDSIARERGVPARAATRQALDQMDTTELADLPDEAARAFVQRLRVERVAS